MRKLLILTVITLSSVNTYSQSWLDVGVKGSWGLNFLYHKNLLDDQDFNETFTSGWNFGGKLGWNIDDFHEITLDVLYYKFSQGYKYNITDSTGKNGPEYSRNMSFSGMQFMLLYRHNNDGRYVEIGPSYSTVSKVSMTDEFYTVDPDYDFKQHMNTGYMGITFGFGGYVIGTQNFGITMGFRINYTASDAGKDDGFNFPAFKTYETYTGTHPLTLMLVMEANLDFAFMAKAKCSNKRKLILF